MKVTIRLIAATRSMAEFDRKWEEQLSAHQQVREDYCMDLDGHYWKDEGQNGWVAGLIPSPGSWTGSLRDSELRLIRQCNLCGRAETLSRRCDTVDGSDVLACLRETEREIAKHYSFHSNHPQRFTMCEWVSFCEKTPYDPEVDPAGCGEDPFPDEDSPWDHSVWSGDGPEDT